MLTIAFGAVGGVADRTRAWVNRKQRCVWSSISM